MWANVCDQAVSITATSNDVYSGRTSSRRRIALDSSCFDVLLLYPTLATTFFGEGFAAEVVVAGKGKSCAYMFRVGIHT